MVDLGSFYERMMVLENLPLAESCLGTTLDWPWNSLCKNEGSLAESYLGNCS